MEAAIAIRLDIEVLAWLREPARLQHGGQTHPVRGGARALPDALRASWNRVSATMPVSDTLDMLRV